MNSSKVLSVSFMGHSLTVTGTVEIKSKATANEKSAFDKWTLDSKDYQVATINAETGKVNEAMAVLAAEVKVTDVTGNGEYTFEAKFEKDEIGKDGGTNGGDGIPTSTRQR